MSFVHRLLTMLIIITLVVPPSTTSARSLKPQASSVTSVESPANSILIGQTPVTSTGTIPVTVPSSPIALQLRSGAFDPTQTEPVVPATLSRIANLQKPGLFLVQFDGPIEDVWYAALLKSELQVVIYLPDYAYLVWGKANAIDELATNAPLRWSGVYQPLYALDPQLLPKLNSTSEVVEVNIQIYKHSDVDSTQKMILERAQLVREPSEVLTYRNLRVRIAADQLTWLAGLADVVNVELAPNYQLNDEIQGQIMAGNLNSAGTQPSGPGYLAWLASIGLPTTASAYPIVDVTDDGIDTGAATPTHADFWSLGASGSPDGHRLTYNYNWTADPLPDGQAGHGNINASIVAGYNDRTGFPYEDTSGATANYNFGLGINPYGRVSGSKVFNNAGSWGASASNSTIISNSYALGSRISTNSWGCGPTGGCTTAPYTTDSQEYDALVRDAQPGAVAGNQPMIVVFAAGNDGSTASTIGSPGTAKNVLTVGAAENYRPTAADGCGVATTGADSAQDIISFSSRGPTSDGRIKPDIVAPGTHIMGAASQDAGFDGSGVCGASTNDFAAPGTDAYYPASQTLYTWSSGTSHSTPAVAGAASLIYRYYQDRFGGSAPSPAMVKAYLINSTRYLTGTGASGNLPTNAQGYGEVNLGRAFDAVPRFVVDQSYTFGSTGQTYALQGSVADSGQPLRITLAWTDAPGPTTGNAYVNNLDLTVTANGNTYRGNVFTGANSVTGGTADVRNNIESVFLPAGISGNVLITVTATNIAGDGVPNNADATDQDFALVVYNGATSALNGTVSNAISANPIVGATVQVYPGPQTTTTDVAGAYQVSPLLSGVYSLTASAYGYQSATINNITVGAVTTTQNVALTPIANYYVVSGYVRDATTNWPLYASIAITPYPTGTVWSDPVTGFYSVSLPEGTAFTFNVSAYAPGYTAASRSFTVTGNRTENFNLSPDTFACTAPGYQKTTATLANSSTNLDSTSGTALPAGWSNVTVLDNGIGTPRWQSTATGSTPAPTPHSATRMVFFNSFSVASGSTARFYRTGGENLSAATGAQVSFWLYRYRNDAWDPANDGVQVQISTNGGTTWTAAGSPAYRYDSALTSGTGRWDQYTVDLSAYTGAGMTNVRLGFLGLSDYGYDIVVDDIVMSTYTCVPQAGGLVVGNVYDAAALTALSGATVTRSGGSTTTDTNGFYTLFSPSGSRPFTATLTGYTTGVTTTNIVASTTQRVDFFLPFNQSSYLWTGNTSTNWFVSGNWNPAAVPTTTAGVIIPTNPTGNRWPIVTGTSTIYSLTVQAGAIMTIEQTGLINVNGVVNNNGTLTQIKNVPIGSTTEFLRLTNAAGSTDKYHGLDITPTGSALGVTTVQIRGNQAACTQNANDPIVHRCFEITPSTQAAANLRFWYTETERNNQAANTLKLWHWGNWVQTGAPYTYSESGLTCASGGGTACWFQSSAVATFSPFALGSGNAPTAIRLNGLQASSPDVASDRTIWLLLAASGGLLALGLKKRKRI